MDPELLGNAKSLMEWSERLDASAFKKLSYAPALILAAEHVRIAARLIVNRSCQLMDEGETKRAQRRNEVEQV